MKKIITGRRSSRRVFIGTTENETMKEITPERSQKQFNHSPDGFSWGYPGSGPAQLALAIMLEITNNETLAALIYHQFKLAIIAGLDGDKDFEISVDEIREWIENNPPDYS